jgi:BolA protein
MDAALPVAGRTCGGFDFLGAPTDADAVEIFGVQIHCSIMVGTGSADKARNYAMTAKDRITRTLTDAFRPTSLEVIDESHLHKGHAGHRPEGETHFRVRISAEGFRGKSRVETHRLVNAALAGEFARGLHALAIEAKVPVAA